MEPVPAHRALADAVRVLAMDAVEQAQSGHPGMPMGMADVATVLFERHLKFDPSDPAWPDRDRFVLSAGHGSMLLYALLHLTGYAQPTLAMLRDFRQLHAPTAGHPEHGLMAGIETTTGPLGQGLANAVGMALAERLMNARWGDDLVDHRTYVVVGDGCLMEGISHEAISLAGHLRLNRLVVLWDDNRISIDGPTDLAVSDDQLARFRACHWDALAVDGHDPAAIDAALATAATSARPVLIACRTTIGFGAPTKGGTAAAHGAPLGAAEVAAARAALGWSLPPFELPPATVAAWHRIGARGQAARTAWAARLAAQPDALRARFTADLAGTLPPAADALPAAIAARFAADAPSLATRQSSQQTIAQWAAVLPNLIGGSADLSGSNGTKAADASAVTAQNFAGNYIHYGVREHAMAAAMNGIALHGGLIPFGGTFLVFSDYCRPALRLAALMGLRTIHVMTHDSIGVGEDGPTHQPVEQLAALRAIPGLFVFRPADAVEVAESWAVALNLDAPSVLALTRQSVPAIRRVASADNLVARGGYIVEHASGDPRVVLIGTGSELALALDARRTLEAHGVATRVVSLPCAALFDLQDAAYRAQVLPPGAITIAVEAATGYGWERYTGAQGGFVGMRGYGASGPAEALYRHFAITADAVVTLALARLNGETE